MIASKLSRYCDVIRNRLWRHQWNEDRASETRGWCVKNVFLSSFMDSLCHVNKIMYVLSWRTVSAPLECYFCVYFPRCSATREMNTKIILSWALKHFVTRVHTLFAINCDYPKRWPSDVHKHCSANRYHVYRVYIGKDGQDSGSSKYWLCQD